MNKIYLGRKITSIIIIAWLGLLPIKLIAQTESIYYQLIHPDTEAKSYLLGTFHTYPKGWYEIPKEIKVVFPQINKLITEIGVSTPSRFRTKAYKATHFKKGKTVLDKLNGREKESFQKYLDDRIGGSNSVKMKAINYKPYFMIGQLFPLRFSDSIMSMEAQFETLAKINNKPILGLEQDKKQLLKYYKKYSRLIKYYNLNLLIDLKLKSQAKLFAKYLDGDILGMKKTAGGTSKMAVERNIYWAPQLLEMLREPSFVAVGTGHLLGDLSIQELLKKQGFIVKPIVVSHPRPKALDDYLSGD
jgi:hypothetical protein